MRDAWLVLVISTTACRIDAHEAIGPVDGAPPDAEIVIDAAPPDAENVFHGMRVTIGDTPQWTGGCTDNLPDYSTMMSKFASPMQQQDMDAGWDFDSSADSYTDPSYGFDPPWPTSAPDLRFSIRYRATIHLTAGAHCFQIDTGASGNDIVTGNNGCGQIYVGVAGATPTAPLAETGYQAPAGGPATGCVTAPADGGAELDVVFWYFNVLAPAVLHLEECDGASCTPTAPLSVPALVPL